MFRAHRAHHQERHRHRVPATRDCIDTICLSWW